MKNGRIKRLMAVLLCIVQIACGMPLPHGHEHGAAHAHAQEECQHEQAQVTMTYYSLSEGEWQGNGDGTHTGLSCLTNRVYCPDCGYATDKIIGEAEMHTEDCSFKEGFCVLCGQEGAEPECEHVYVDGWCEKCWHTCEHDSYAGGYCSACGAKENCRHDALVNNNTYYSLYSGSWVCNEDGTHTGMAVKVNWMYCYDCYYGYEDPIEEPAMHTEGCSLENGTCIRCGGTVPCPHPEEYLKATNIFFIVGKEEPVDANNHLVKMNPGVSYHCGLCDEYWSEKDTTTVVEYEEEHMFAGNVCEYCGYEDNCPHETSESQDKCVGEDVWHYRDAQTHILADYFRTDVVCTECGKIIEMGELIVETKDVTQEHTYDEYGMCTGCYYDPASDNVCDRHYYRDSVCIDCGAENDCPHANKSFEEDGRQKNTVITDNGDGTHTRTFDVYHFYTCSDCMESCALYMEQGSETEPHEFHNGGACRCGAQPCERHYYRNGVCIDCGVTNGCAHENAVFEEDGRQKNTVFADNGDGTHTRTFDVYHFYTCGTCGESCALYMEQGSETEPHEFHNGDACRCGAAVCEKHAYDRNGVCAVCGMESSCLHNMGKTMLDYAMIFGDPVYKNEEFHKLPYEVEYVYECHACGSTFMKVNEMEGDEGHHFEDDGLCACGAQGEPTNCDHAQELLEDRWYYENAVYSGITKTHHTRTADLYLATWCNGCSTRRTYQLWTPNEEVTQEHNFAEDGTCECGYQDVCLHVNRGENQTLKIGEFTDQGNGTHAGMVIDRYGYRCQDCKEFIVLSESDAPYEYVAAHEFDPYGFCMALGCGALKADCKHQGAEQTGGTAKNTVVIDNGDGTHTRTFDVYHTFLCGICGEEFETYIEQGVEVEPHEFHNGGACRCGAQPCERHYYRNGVCIDCGVTNGCAHENAVFEEDGRQKNTVFADNGDGTHTRTFDVYHFYTCGTCGESCALYMEQGSETEPHEFHNGGACRCGRIKPCEEHDWSNADGICADCLQICAHERQSSSAFTFNWTYEPLDANMHIYTCDQQIDTTCDICRMLVDTQIHTGLTDIEKHYGNPCGACEYENTCLHESFTDSVCDECGYICEHAQAYENGETFEAEQVYTPDEDGRTHRIDFDIFQPMFCPDCGFDYNVVTGNGTTSGYHVYDEYDAEPDCLLCGYVRAVCQPHDEDEVESSVLYVPVEQTQYTSNGDGTHTFVADKIRFNYCYECGYRWKEILEVHTAYTQECSYEDQNCVFCGAAYVCRHENAQKVGSEERNVSYVDNQDGTHIRKAERYDCYTCADCGESYEQFDCNWEETQAHSYENGESCACGKIVPCDEHDWSDGSSVCTVCGEICRHDGVIGRYTGSFKYADDVGYVDDENGETHSIMGYRQMDYHCETCGRYYSLFEETAVRITLPHNYTDGVCSYCGAENRCSHPEESMSYSYELKLVEGYQWEINPSTHTGYAYKEHTAYCLNCDQFTITRDEPFVQSQGHIIMGNGECRICGYKNTCIHPNDNVTGWMAYELASGAVWTPDENGMTHSAMACKILMQRCSLCTSVWSIPQESEPQYYTIAHTYQNDVCESCGFANPCSHPEEALGWGKNYRLVSGASWTDNGDGTHTGNCYEYTFWVCGMCKTSREEMTGDAMVRTLEHDFFRDVCQYCGAQNICLHENAQTFIWYDYLTDPLPEDGLVHAYLADVHRERWCSACQTNLESTLVAEGRTVFEEHIFEDGVCVDCGYERVCDHHQTEERCYYINGRDYAAQGEQGHSGVYDYSKYTFCAICNEMLSEEVLQEDVTYVEPHVFGEELDGGTCYYCDYATTCRHEGERSIFSWYRAYASSLIPSDDGHSFVATRVDQYGCADCGTILEHVETENVTVSEPHAFNAQGMCIYCLYVKEECTHEMGGEELGYEMIFGDPVRENADFHYLPYTVVFTYRCHACQETCTESNEMEGYEGHTFDENGVCACGEKGETTTCTHENTRELNFHWYGDYFDITPTSHTLSTDLYYGRWCDDCQTWRMAQLDFPDYVGTLAHTFEEGVCECGKKMLDGVDVVFDLPGFLRSIGEEAFAGSAIDAVIIPETCAEIGSRAFADCASLGHVVMTDSIVSIAQDAFDGCGDLLIYAPEESAGQEFAEKYGYVWLETK